MLKKNDQLQENEVVDGPPLYRHVFSAIWALIKRCIRFVAQFVMMIMVLFVGLFIMARLTALKEVKYNTTPFKTVYTVNSVIAERGTYQPDMLVYGEVQVSKAIELRPLVSGKIIEINPDLKVGASIGEGEMLFKVDPFSFETALDTARSNAAETRARIAENQAKIAIEESRIRSLRDQLDIARNDLDRITRLRERGTATAKEVEDRTLIVSQRTQSLEQSELNLVAENARLDQQKSVLSRYDRSVEQAQRNLEDTVLYAPVSGVVSANNSAVGRYIGPSDMTVSMYEADRLEVRFTLTDQRFGRIQSDSTGVLGRELEVIWSVGGEEFRYPGVIDRISAQIASTRGGVEVIATIDGRMAETQLRPGAFVEIILPDKAFEGYFKIPDSAIYDSDTVYVIREGVLENRTVRILAREGDEVIVDGMLETGDEVMTTKIAEISKGLQVRSTDDAGHSSGAGGAVDEGRDQ